MARLGLDMWFYEDALHARVPFVAQTQPCFAVKAETDGLLDIAKRSFCDTSEGLLQDDGFDLSSSKWFSST